MASAKTLCNSPEAQDDRKERGKSSCVCGGQEGLVPAFSFTCLGRPTQCLFLGRSNGIVPSKARSGQVEPSEGSTKEPVSAKHTVQSAKPTLTQHSGNEVIQSSLAAAKVKLLTVQPLFQWSESHTCLPLPLSHVCSISRILKLSTPHSQHPISDTLTLFSPMQVAITAPAAALGAHMVKRLRAFAGMSRMKRLALVVLARTLTDNDVKRLRVRGQLFL